MTRRPWPKKASRRRGGTRKVAPDAPHALHMPSHIFTRVGYWRDSIASNAASVHAAQESKEAADQLHAMDYEVYAYLQLGQDAQAKAVIDEMMTVPVSGDTVPGCGIRPRGIARALHGGTWRLEGRGGAGGPARHVALYHSDLLVRQRAWRGPVRRHGAGSGGDHATRGVCGTSYGKKRTPIGPGRSIFSR